VNGIVYFVVIYSHTR